MTVLVLTMCCVGAGIEMHACAFMAVYAHECVYVSLCVSVCLSVCIYLSVCVSAYVFVYVCVRMYMRLCRKIFRPSALTNHTPWIKPPPLCVCCVHVSPISLTRALTHLQRHQKTCCGRCGTCGVGPNPPRPCRLDRLLSTTLQRCLRIRHRAPCRT
jgi:hypothetical protein